MSKNLIKIILDNSIDVHYSDGFKPRKEIFIKKPSANKNKKEIWSIKDVITLASLQFQQYMPKSPTEKSQDVKKTDGEKNKSHFSMILNYDQKMQVLNILFNGGLAFFDGEMLVTSHHVEEMTYSDLDKIIDGYLDNFLDL